MMSSNSKNYSFFFYAKPRKRKGKIKYIVEVYSGDEKIDTIWYILSDVFVIRFFTYRQWLIGEYVDLIESGKKMKRFRIRFKPGSERNALLYLYYLLSIKDLRSSRRVDKLAKCFAGIDTVSPLIDLFHELYKSVGERKFKYMMRGFCLATR